MKKNVAKNALEIQHFKGLTLYYGKTENVKMWFPLTFYTDLEDGEYNPIEIDSANRVLYIDSGKRINSFTIISETEDEIVIRTHTAMVWLLLRFLPLLGKDFRLED